MEDLIKFISESMLSGTVGNATFEALKNLFGDKFDRLFKYLKNNENEKFIGALETVLDENEELKKQITSLKEGIWPHIISNGIHSTGDYNINIINNIQVKEKHQLQEYI